MEWNQAYTIIGVNIGLIGALATLIIYVVNRLDRDVNSLSSNLQSLGLRMDARFESQSARIDQLYKMFVDLLRERK